MSATTILVVEDDGLIALRTMELLTKAGYSVPDPAPTGEDALEFLATGNKPDLILMDIGLAGKIDGIETARRVRDQYKIPVVFLSAYTNDSIMTRMKEVGPAGYLVKPFLDKDLLAEVERVLAAKEIRS